MKDWAGPSQAPAPTESPALATGAPGGQALGSWGLSLLLSHRKARGAPVPPVLLLF